MERVVPNEMTWEPGRLEYDINQSTHSLYSDFLIPKVIDRVILMLS